MVPTRRAPRPTVPELGLLMARVDLETLRERLDTADDRLRGAVIAPLVADHHRAAHDVRREAEQCLCAAVTAEELVVAVGLLATGRQHLAHVEAHVAGEDPPADRPPCLFDPAHGPSVADATWTTVRHGTRRVPACLQDTALLAAGVPPDRRTVEVAGRHVAYWEAGEDLEPYLQGYFAGHPLLDWVHDRGNRLPRGVVAPPDPIYGDSGTWGGFGA